MSTQNGKSNQTNSFALLKRTKQKGAPSITNMSHRSQRNGSKTPKRLNDISHVPEMDKLYPETTVSAQQTKDRIQVSVRPQSTKSTNYQLKPSFNGQSSSGKEQFDRYLRNQQAQYDERSNRSNSKKSNGKNLQDSNLLNNYNVSYSFRGIVKRQNSPGRNVSELSPGQNYRSLYQSTNASKSFTKNTASERKLLQRPLTSNQLDQSKRLKSSRSNSRTPDRVVDTRKASLKSTATTLRKIKDDSSYEQAKLTKIGSLSTRSKNFSSCQVLKEVKPVNLKREILDLSQQKDQSYDTPLQTNTDFTPSITPTRFDDSTTSTKVALNQYNSEGSKPSTTKGKVSMSSKALPKQEPKKLGSLVTQVRKGQIFPTSKPMGIVQVQVTQTQKPRQSKQLKQQQEEKTERPRNGFNRIGYQNTQFKGAQYYQTSLVHFHYQQVHNKPSPLTQQFREQFGSEVTNKYFKEIYEEHFVQSFYSLRYCMTIPPRPLSEILAKIHYLPQHKNAGSDLFGVILDYRRTIVFDLDETLIHCNDSNEDPCDFMVEIDFPENETIQACINVRPHCRQILETLSQHFELLVFTASHKCYAEAVLNNIDPQKRFFKARFFRESCVQAGEGLYIKDLRVIGNRNLQVQKYYQLNKDILLIDNASYSFCHQIENGVPIVPFYDNAQDRELLYLQNYLLDLKDKQDWIAKNKQMFNFDLYKNASSIEECLRSLIDLEL